MNATRGFVKSKKKNKKKMQTNKHKPQRHKKRPVDLENT